MSILAELDTSLQALQALKPPGVTKSRIAAITTLCVENIKSESVLVQKIFTHFKRTPATHKLGVLYVIDSVTRQWIDKASTAGQELSGSAAPDGTFAAGVHRVTELLPIMMNDLIPTAPYDQKDKISKLVDIWERGSIFPANLLSDFKKKLDARRPDPVEPAFPVDHTNLNAPPASLPSAIPTAQPSLSGQSPSSLLSGLKDLGNTSAQPGPSVTAANSALNGLLGQATQSQPPANPAVATQQNVPAITPEQVNALASVIPAHIASNPEALQKHLQLLQQLVQLGVPPEQWMIVIEAMQNQNQNQNQNQAQNQVQSYNNNQHQSQQPLAQNQSLRERSRSPPRRRDSPVYGKVESNYRQRSPGRSNTPSMQMDRIPLSEPKWTEFDSSLPEGHIRVLSRTLFVGGTTCNEEELRGIFSQFGQVQTCIPNPDKRHAFIKYCNRAGAIAAKEQMANITDPNLLARVRSVRWGVGFGPRDCNDYTTGVSVIPIQRLTEADRKWVLTAPFGGTGGKPIETGLVIEEPDIEIGAGVSSKAISRRLGEHETSRRGKGGGQDHQRFNNRRQERDHQQSPKSQQQGYRAPAAPSQQRHEPVAPPAVPGFGFQFPGTSMGMPPYTNRPS